MLCEICHSRPATVQLAQIVHDEKRVLHVCQECAEKYGLTLPFGVLPHLFAGILLQLIGQSRPGVSPEELPHCPTCGLSYQDVERTGLLGCPDCYTAFADQLRTLLRRIHGSAKHIGSRPPQLRRAAAATADPEEIRRALEEAVAREDYERAAELRDLLRDLTRQTRGDSR